jgi:hypothetical protein
MRGDPDDRIWSGDRPDVLDGQIVLADVDAVGRRERGDVGAIVDDQAGARPVTGAGDRIGEVEERAAPEGLAA